MIGILIISHGDFARGMLSAAELISGEQEKLEVLGLYPGDSPEDFEQKILATLKKLDDGDGVIGFVDFLGGSPASTAMKVLKEKLFPCITGANMPMLTEALLDREDPGLTLDQIAAQCVTAGAEGMTRLDEVVKNIIAKNA
ncbi:hypothetical protein AGMMS49587_14980 [Spirochaetia bacterium]|nr:hypothetical protein AGMMS49587_14980 [Spirochaetia bacterium]